MITTKVILIYSEKFEIPNWLILTVIGGMLGIALVLWRNSKRKPPRRK